MSLEYIRLQEASCHNCMRCVRSCPIDAMTYVKNQPMLIQEDCILCGKCYVVCSHEAKMVYSDLAKVKTWLQNNECVILSVAPSFTAVWPNFESLKKVLLKYGFYDVLETSEGAALVSKAYANLMAEHQMKNIITTCCPSVNTYIEKYYGELATYLAPVVSPMIAHAKMIKEQYPDSKVVFLTPCISKIKEAQDERFAGHVDACLSMEEVHTWIYEKMIPEDVEKWQDFEGSIARLYPCPSGILSTIEPNIADENLCIKRVNPSAMKMLNIDYECENLPLGMILPDEALCRLVQLTGYQPEYIRIQYPQYEKLIDHAIVKLRQEPYTVLILMDRTLEAYKEEILKQMREETIQVTQQVIDEQMRTVQEIASLLGETTAKTKVALTHLKQMMDEVDDA